MNYSTIAITRAEAETLGIPFEIWQVPDPPEKIYVQGARRSLPLLKQLPEKGLAVVGTRDPQPRSIAMVKKIIPRLSPYEVVVISGLARGVDAAAHEAALDSGIPTLAILGAGHDIDYPKENILLRQRILESGGLVLSEFGPGVPAQKHQFLQRNRLIAGWSKATWVVEAGARSGALNTARWAREQDRTCFALPCFPGDPALAGNQTLLDRDHALALWDVHSLGAVWLDMANPRQSEALSLEELKANQNLTDDEKGLIQMIISQTYQQGGAQTLEVFNWAADQHWNPRRFYVALQKSLALGFIEEKNGVLVSLSKHRTLAAPNQVT